MKRTKIAEVLNRDDVRSRVMKDGAYFDVFLGIAIGMYFTSDDRFSAFHELIIDRLSFDEKLRAIEKLPLKKSYKSIAALPVIRHIQKVRNLVAHEWHIHDRDRRIINANWLYLFSDYPVSYDTPIKLARSRLWRLSATKEFLLSFEKGNT